jgi:hypothetical protein
MLFKNPAVFLVEHDIYKMYRVFGLLLPSYLLSTIDCLVLSVFALIMVRAVLLSFKKTVSSEIFYFSFWLAALSFEPLRILHLFLAMNGQTDTLLGAVDKLYMSIRIFGYICLFISGLYAAGMRSERQLSVVAAAAVTSGLLTFALPVNSGIWAWNLMFKAGYGGLNDGFTMVIILITVANYLIAVRVRGDKAFYFIAAGMAGVSIGAFFMSRDSSPLTSLSALVAMGLGGRVYVHRLHSFYLWQ